MPVASRLSSAVRGRLALFLAALFALPLLTGAAPSPAPAPAPITDIAWSTVAPQPIGTSEAQAVVVNGTLYSFGGFDQQTSCCTPTDRAYAYDPAADTWASLAPLPGMPEDDGPGTLPGGVTHAGVTTDGSVIYFAGGYTANAAGTGQIFGTNNVWAYDPASDSYSFLPDLPQPRAAGGLV
jgi:N-acetylneuraminic acid mutarotase